MTFVHVHHVNSSFQLMVVVLTCLHVCVCCLQSVWCPGAAAMACSGGQSNAETLEGFHEVNLASPTTPDLQVGTVTSGVLTETCWHHITRSGVS